MEQRMSGRQTWRVNAVGLRPEVEQRGEMRGLGAHARPCEMEEEPTTAAKGMARRRSGGKVLRPSQKGSGAGQRGPGRALT